MANESLTVLRTIYEEEILFDHVPDSDSQVISTISEKTNLDEGCVRNALKYLYKVGLIESTEYGGHGEPYGLSEKGFEVINDRETKEKELEHEEELREQQRDHLEELREQQRSHDEKVAKRQSEVTERTGKYTLYLVLAVSLQSLTASLRIEGWQGVVLGLLVFLIVIAVGLELVDATDRLQG